LLGEDGAEVFLSRPVAAHTSLRIVLGSDNHISPAELYARVTAAEVTESASLPGATHLIFTWVPEEVKQYFATKIGLEH